MAFGWISATSFWIAGDHSEAQAILHRLTEGGHRKQRLIGDLEPHPALHRLLAVR